jgi:hypothetical protein
MGAFTYPRSEPGSGGHLDLVEQLNAMTTALQAEVGGLPDAVTTFRPKDKGPSIKDTLAQLSDDASTMHMRLHMMAKLEDPHLPDLGATAGQADAPIGETLNRFAAQQGETVELLADLVHWNWARTGHDSALGRISIRQQVDLWLAHQSDSLERVRRLKREATSTKA